VLIPLRQLKEEEGVADMQPEEWLDSVEGRRGPSESVKNRLEDEEVEHEYRAAVDVLRVRYGRKYVASVLKA
jgi:hypothetical protein